MTGDSIMDPCNKRPNGGPSGVNTQRCLRFGDLQGLTLTKTATKREKEVTEPCSN